MIILRIPTFKEELGEDVEIWLHQIKNILRAQEVKDSTSSIFFS
ncbi:11721_t:CDS:2 [Acaulospora colombiana]|uniref:11721_t:CDS:1 n=1 Tax=Acaulospora colombiana TaxID=27376 RepID=A0ACA9JX20_9GLOM|nr:11721_t:CDS:2 [Acaulospora colombiana]